MFCVLTGRGEVDIEGLAANEGQHTAVQAEDGPNGVSLFACLHFGGV